MLFDQFCKCEFGYSRYLFPPVSAYSLSQHELLSWVDFREANNITFERVVLHRCEAEIFSHTLYLFSTCIDKVPLAVADPRLSATKRTVSYDQEGFDSRWLFVFFCRCAHVGFVRGQNYILRVLV